MAVLAKYKQDYIAGRRARNIAYPSLLMERKPDTLEK